ncbi:MAG: hypothetical protein Q9N32_04410 [Gammaproteobacteria bacterium]|nr:hypothetical protein [Gammaproteobacteria bacterium]
MNISALGQSFTATNPLSGNKAPPQSKMENSISQNNTQSTKVDMKNISIHEVNTLIKSGESSLLDVVPFIPPNTLQQYDYNPEKIGTIRVDLIGQVETSIEFKRSIGESTDFLESVLKNFKALDGTELNKRIDVLA